MKGASLYEGTGFISFGHGSGAHTLAAPGAARFEATRWSEVLQSAQSRAPGGPEALARLCERYWPPLYAFDRHRGHGPEDAQDLVQGFFEHLIESKALGTIDQAKGRFRSFLLASFQNFTSMERRRAGAEKRGGRAELIRMDWQDAESRIAFEPEDRAHSGNGLRRALGPRVAWPGHAPVGTGTGCAGQSPSLPHPAAFPGG
jgi:DNA-directed RNA polymerase specialized sigma24 family protein